MAAHRAVARERKRYLPMRLTEFPCHPQIALVLPVRSCLFESLRDIILLIEFFIFNRHSSRCLVLRVFFSLYLFDCVMAQRHDDSQGGLRVIAFMLSS